MDILKLKKMNKSQELPPQFEPVWVRYAMGDDVFCRKGIHDGLDWRIVQPYSTNIYIPLPPEAKVLDWSCIPNPNEEDSVNHPSHYNTGKFECRDVMIEVFGKEDYIAFCKLSAFKYVFRGGKKEGNSERRDLQKAVWYLNDVIELTKNEE